MCGFVGWFRFDGQDVPEPVLRKMGEVLKHRGPDGEGLFLRGPVGLVHKRLAIIDPEGGHQPMTFGGVTIAYNGEVYNFVELRQELRNQGHTFSTSSACPKALLL